ncbi:hypothetical protein HK101_002249 [Irineochytrium annulatum]|nr:hypothetical protein HK101_002249 [Irineochytrium annulatum]
MYSDEDGSSRSSEEEDAVQDPAQSTGKKRARTTRACDPCRNKMALLEKRVQLVEHVLEKLAPGELALAPTDVPSAIRPKSVPKREPFDTSQTLKNEASVDAGASASSSLKPPNIPPSRGSYEEPRMPQTDVAEPSPAPHHNINRHTHPHRHQHQHQHQHEHQHHQHQHPSQQQHPSQIPPYPQYQPVGPPPREIPQRPFIPSIAKYPTHDIAKYPAHDSSSFPMRPPPLLQPYRSHEMESGSPRISQNPPISQSFKPSEGGMLTDPAGTRFTFFGCTSAIGGNAMFRSSRRFAKGCLITRGEMTPHQAAEPAYKSLDEFIPCSPDLVFHLVNYYFEQFHPVFPMIEREKFMKEVMEALNSRKININNWAFLLLLISLVTVMLQFTPSLRRWNIQESPDELALSCLKVAKKIIDDNLEKSHCSAVQAMLLLAMSAAGRKGRGTLMWMFSGMAVRKAQEMGLHRNLAKAGISHPQLDELANERQRTWFCCLIAETYISIMSGRPMAITSQDWDTDYPRDNTEDVTNLLRHVELAGIFASISRFANRAQPVDRDTFIMDVEGRLARWYSILEPSWLDGVFQRWDSKAFMLLMYHSATILFHRAAFNRMEDDVCLNSAQLVVKMFDALPTIDLGSDSCCVIFPTIPYGLMLNCTVFIARLMANGGQGNHLLRSIKRCLQAFDNMRGLSINAMRIERIINEYLSGKGIRLPPNDLSSSMSSSSSLPSPSGSTNTAESITSSLKMNRMHMESIVDGMERRPTPTSDSDLGMWWDGMNFFDLAGV